MKTWSLLLMFILTSCKLKKNVINEIQMQSTNDYTQIFDRDYSYKGIYTDSEGKAYLKMSLNDEDELIYFINERDKKIILVKSEISSNLLRYHKVVGDKADMKNQRIIDEFSILDKTNFFESEIYPIIGFDYIAQNKNLYFTMISNWTGGGNGTSHFIAQFKNDKIRILNIQILNQKYSPSYIDLVAPTYNKKTHSFLFVPREEENKLIQYQIKDEKVNIFDIPLRIPVIDLIPNSGYIILYDSLPEKKSIYILKLKK